MHPIIRIDLERPDGVYHAEEIVRGTVTVQSSGLQCQAISLCFTAEARVQWLEDSGENQHHYKGSTTFQKQNETLYGDTFRTIMVGDKDIACFDRIRGSGSIRIPCNWNEEQHCLLLLKINGYDRRHRRTTLGKTVLDVPRLVRSRNRQTLEWMNDDNSKKGSITLSAEFLPFEEVYFSQIQGTASVPVKPLCLILRVHQVTAYLVRRAFSVEARRLPETEQMIRLPEEAVILPFSFQLPADAPGSADFSELKPHKCSVQYTLRTYIEITSSKVRATETMFRVVPKLSLPPIALLTPARIEMLDQTIYNCSYCGWKCCQVSGLISIKLQLERLVYAPNEPLRLAGVVVNDSDETLPIFVVFTQHFSLRNVGEWNEKEHTIPFHYDLFQSQISALSTVTLQELAGIEQVRIPSIFPSFNGAATQSQPADARPCLKWSYTLEVRVGKSRDAAYRNRWQMQCRLNVDRKTAIVACRIPLLICGTAPQPDHIEAARSMRPPAIIPDPFLFLDTYADTKLETNESYSSTTDAGSVKMQLASGRQLNDSNIQALLNEMDHSVEKRIIVRTWIQKHPIQAQNLTPHDFGRILHRVILSTDKNDVVNELVAAVAATKKLTCAHIVSALEACPFQKTDMARCMAPHVNDPEDKDLVLGKIDYEFEREMVMHMFSK